MVCADKTKKFEQICARKMFGPLRYVFDLPTRRRRERPQKLEVLVNRGTGFRPEKVNIADYPTLLLAFPELPVPGFEVGEPPKIDFKPWVLRNYVVPVPDQEGRNQRLAGGLPIVVRAFAEMHLPSFLKLLCKISHAMAVLYFGIYGFEPWLPRIILGEIEEFHYVVGGMPAETGPPPDECPEWGFHDVIFGLRKVTRGGNQGWVLVAGVRVFKNIASPQYLIGVGAPTQETVDKITKTAHNQVVEPLSKFYRQ